jgi:LysR family glycine cleavage system transcriptional activator
MRKLLPMRTLQSFNAVADFPSFSSAAEALGMTHGAISHQIRALETWLGKEVFDRHSGGVRLTEDGERLRQACTQAFLLLEEECGRIRQQPAERNVTIGCSATFLAHWLLPRVETFSRERPEAVLSFRTRIELSSVLARKVDVLIVSASSDPPDGIEGICLSVDVIGPVCAPSWPTMPSTPEEVEKLPLLHATSRLNAWDEWASAVGVGLDRSRGRRFESLSLTIEAARGGLGLAVTPEFLVRDDIDAGRLEAPLGFVKVKRATWVYVSRAHRNDPEISAFVDWLVAEARNGIAIVE